MADIPLAIFFDEATASATVFDRRLEEEDEPLTFEPGSTPRRIRDLETKSEWNMLTGEAVSGPLQGTHLNQVPVTYAFWFGWIDYYTRA